MKELQNCPMIKSDYVKNNSGFFCCLLLQQLGRKFIRLLCCITVNICYADASFSGFDRFRHLFVSYVWALNFRSQRCGKTIVGVNVLMTGLTSVPIFSSTA